jgi:hypothetical protein
LYNVRRRRLGSHKALDPEQAPVDGGLAAGRVPRRARHAPAGLGKIDVLMPFAIAFAARRLGVVPLYDMLRSCCTVDVDFRVYKTLAHCDDCKRLCRMCALSPVFDGIFLEIEWKELAPQAPFIYIAGPHPLAAPNPQGLQSLTRLQRQVSMIHRGALEFPGSKV